jgi:hypothetical protein
MDMIAMECKDHFLTVAHAKEYSSNEEDENEEKGNPINNVPL